MSTLCHMGQGTAVLDGGCGLPPHHCIQCWRFGRMSVFEQVASGVPTQ